MNEEQEPIQFYEGDEGIPVVLKKPERHGRPKGRKKKIPHKTNLGSLKLEAPHEEQLRKVLRHFGYESVPAFLRQCALGLLRQKDAKLILPLQFKTHRDL